MAETPAERRAMEQIPMTNKIHDRVTAGTRPGPLDRVVPGPGQESVWDYPRPPRIEPVPERLRVVVDGVTIANTTRGFRVLETAGAPVYYFPPEDVRLDLLRTGARRTVCEWKGAARYHSLRIGERTIEDVGWSYPDPNPAFEAIRDHVAFYAGRVDEAWVGDELATPQPGGFYGGWITSRVVGPFKGDPGSFGW
jgi:uncharacterized protein (DUF427 family)